MFSDLNELVSEWRSFISVVRVTSGEELRVWPCCSVPVGCRVHWFRRRTVPCVAAIGACPGCVTASRPLVFLGVVVGKPGRDGYTWSPVRVLELPVGTYAVVKQEAAAAGGLTSVSFMVRRHGGKRGRVVADMFEKVPPRDSVSEFEVIQALCRMWSVPAPRVGELDSDWLMRVGVSISCDGHYSPSPKG